MLSCSANDILESLQVTGKLTEFLVWHNAQLIRINDQIQGIEYGRTEDTVYFKVFGEVSPESILIADRQLVNNPFDYECNSLKSFLKSNPLKLTEVVPGNYEWISVDLSKYNPMALNGEYVKYLLDTCRNFEGTVGFGGYAEDRPVYGQHALFQGTEDRSIHLGVDIWATEGTPVCSPWDGVVHSFADNVGTGNYGPTIILEHCEQGITFYSLYGHLSRKSLERKYTGQSIEAGKSFCDFGSEEDNGNWYPHLHFQVMAHMLGMQGDFPGVCAKSESAFWLQVCSMG